jgi:hypothetical protein
MRPLIVKIVEDCYLNDIITLDVLGFLRLVAPYLLPGLPAKEELDITRLSTHFWDYRAAYRADGVISITRLKDRRDPCGLPILHLEVEHAWSPRLGGRIEPCRRAMEKYHQREILTVALVLHGDRSGFLIEETPFRWLRFALPGCEAAQYLTRDEPVAWALAAAMDPGDWSPLQHKLECYRRLVMADGVAGKLRYLLEQWFALVIPLPDQQQDALEKLLETESGCRIQRFAFS